MVLGGFNMRIVELFAGYGSQALALRNLGIEFTSDISEIDKYAIKAYNQIHGETRNYGDITKIESLDCYDLWTYSFPCQDLSFAGKQAGIKQGTRSGLLYEVERLLDDAVKNNKQPKYMLLENVKALVSKKFMPDFQLWLNKLDEFGYNNYWQVLNAKDYGIPQNRERVFVVSIRKDIDIKGYKFPEKILLEKRLKDVLEPCVDVKYYLSEKAINGFLKHNINHKNKKTGFIWKPKDLNDCANALRANSALCPTDNTIKIKEPLCAASRGRNPENPSDRTAGIPTEQMLEINYSGCTNTLTSVQKDNYVVEPKVIKAGNIYTSKGQNGNVYSCEGVCPTILSGQGIKGNGIGSNNAPKVIQVGNIASSKIWDNPQTGRVYSPDGCSPTLNTCGGGSHEPKIIEGYRIRKLTPRECFRLMGVKDEQFNRLDGISNSQLYKLAGNSIVVNVLEAIFRNLFIETNIEKKGQLDLF